MIFPSSGTSLNAVDCHGCKGSGWVSVPDDPVALILSRKMSRGLVEEWAGILALVVRNDTYEKDKKSTIEELIKMLTEAGVEVEE